MIEYTLNQFNQHRMVEQWSLVARSSGDFDAFSRDVGPNAMRQLQSFLPEIRKLTEPLGRGPGQYTIQLDETAAALFVSLRIGSDDLVRVWECKRDDARPADGAACLRMLAPLALGARQDDIKLRFSEQEDKAFMWRAPSVHPLQMLENAYQREVREAERQEAEKGPDADPITAQSEALAHYFMQGEGEPVRFGGHPSTQADGAQLAAVRMNHLIATFYLFRLLVRYQVESSQPISDDLRVDLSGNLTKLLHNGDRERMGWLTAWLTTKIAEVGKMINELNPREARGSERRVIFFLKGGRALNYFLGTPEKGENDWDTQVVINPALPAKEWYDCLAEVHDKLLSALKQFKGEFAELVEANAGQFGEYLSSKVGPEVGEDEEPDENDLNDVHSRGGRANCKAELIDIGIPRRDSPSALEEWTRLSADGALEKSRDGVWYPRREYYLNEYLMMIRDAFAPNADTKKAPKRITRFGLILASGGHEPSRREMERWVALPQTKRRVDQIRRKATQQLFLVMMPQFVEAYNLLQDWELADLFDRRAADLITRPPTLPPVLAQQLNAEQTDVALDVGVAHALSEWMQKHWADRNNFFIDQEEVFTPLLQELFQATDKPLKEVGAQFAIASSYAAHLHAEHLHLKPDGLEPIRRILVKLQCPSDGSEKEVMQKVRGTICDIARTYKLQVGENLPDPKVRSLVLFWGQQVQIGEEASENSFKYAPLVMKVRGARQPGKQLPVLASINGLPTLDLRYVAADYLRKSSKIDERGARLTLASATAAVSEMLSRFEIRSDEDEED
jgi:hypothetical protein